MLLKTDIFTWVDNARWNDILPRCQVMNNDASLPPLSFTCHLAMISSENHMLRINQNLLTLYNGRHQLFHWHLSLAQAYPYPGKPCQAWPDLPQPRPNIRNSQKPTASSCKVASFRNNHFPRTRKYYFSCRFLSGIQQWLAKNNRTGKQGCHFRKICFASNILFFIYINSLEYEGDPSWKNQTGKQGCHFLKSNFTPNNLFFLTRILRSVKMIFHLKIEQENRVAIFWKICFTPNKLFFIYYNSLEYEGDPSCKNQTEKQGCHFRKSNFTQNNSFFLPRIPWNAIVILHEIIKKENRVAIFGKNCFAQN